MITWNNENVKIAVPFKYVGKFWRTLKMIVINFKRNLK